jgi:autotransporter-associated beta strand protein
VVTRSPRTAHRALMNIPHRLALALVLGLLSIAAGSTPAFAATRIWSGAGANNLWSTPQNWDGNIAPVSGDFISFPNVALQTTNVNDLPAGTLFSSIQFLGTYIVTGNRVLIDNNIRVNGANGILVLFACDITTGGNGATELFIDIGAGRFLITTGVISGAQPLQKINEGTWNIGGGQPNTFTAELRVYTGAVVLNKAAGMAAAPAGLSIGDNVGASFGDIVRLASDHQILGPVTIRNTGWLDLNGNVDAIGALTMGNTSRITTGVGELTLLADVEATGVNATIDGRLALGGAPRVFTTTTTNQGTYALSINAVISGIGGDGGIIKRGPGILILAGANGYGGFTRIETGTLWAGSAQSLGLAAADAGTGVLAGGRLVVFDNIANEPLLIEKGSATASALECGGAGVVSWFGPIDITGSTGVFTPAGCGLRLGSISGTGELWIGGNVVEFNASNTYVGDTRVQSGMLRLNGSTRIPDTSTVRLIGTSLLSLNGFNEVVGSITGDSTSQIFLGNGFLTVATPINTETTFAGVITGTGSVAHSGPGRWILTGANQHTGTTTVSNGTLQLDGSLATGVIINAAGVLTGTGHASGVVVGTDGEFWPGRDGQGTFTTGSLALSGAGHVVTFDIRPGGGTRIDAHGTVNLFGNAELFVRKAAGVQIDSPRMLINNDNADAVGNTFDGLPEGAIFSVGDQDFRITYAGGDGNDVVITPTELAYYLSEGSTGTFFDTDILIANPHNTTVPVTVEFLVEGGGQVITQDYLLPRQSRTTIAVDAIQGLESTAVSTKVRSTLAIPIVVERTMWWSGDARYGAHTEKASGGPAERWYFAEGSQGFFFTYLLLANPLVQANEATVRFLLEGGGEVVKTYPLTPLSRQTVAAGDVPELVGQSFGIEVTFTHGGVAERAMYFGLEPLWTAGHESAGVIAPATTWFLAEGATGPFFETFILIANPNASPADTTVRFLPASGAPVVTHVAVPANGRVTLNIEPQDASLANAAVATEVSSPVPIVVERAQYWPDPAPQWYEAHNSFGVTETALKWGLAEGRVGDAAGFQTYVLLANPSANAAAVTITFLRESGAPLIKQFTVNPSSRLNVAIGSGSDVPELTNERFGALIESNVPIAVERAMYANAGSQVWGAGTNATATRLP